MPCWWVPRPLQESYLPDWKEFLPRRNKPVPMRFIRAAGFFSENAGFARAVEKARHGFHRTPARRDRENGRQGRGAQGHDRRRSAGGPGLARTPWRLSNRFARLPSKIGYPISVVKASAGGGGKGMRLVEDDKNLASVVRSVASEAKSSFGDGRFYVEKFVRKPRHIEVQVFADKAGNTVHMFERECFDSAAQSESRGRIAFAICHSRDAREEMGRGRSASGEGGEVRGRRHHRVSCRRGPQFLFPRNEHPHSGRASGARRW